DHGHRPGVGQRLRGIRCTDGKRTSWLVRNRRRISLYVKKDVSL
ncbi:uncharacterized protein METZ01_LOCUS306106, partial [marine metagenome]